MTGTVRELAEAYWDGTADLTYAQHPVLPAGGRLAEELQPGVLYLESMASVTAVDTGDGLVLLDTGAFFDRGAVFGGVRQWRPTARLAAAVFSHHHVDHVFGTAPFEAESVERGGEQPTVYANEDVAADFARYVRTAGWNSGTPASRRQSGWRSPAGWTVSWSAPSSWSTPGTRASPAT